MRYMELNISLLKSWFAETGVGHCFLFSYAYPCITNNLSFDNFIYAQTPTSLKISSKNAVNP